MRAKNRAFTIQRDRLPVTIFVLLPLILVAGVAVYVAITQGRLPIPGIKWNDEAAYYALVKTYATQFYPKGYWGFDGNHAILGTGSAWNPAILLPYIITAYVFNWGYSAVFWTNLFWVSWGNFMFLDFTQPKRNQIFRFIILQATSVILILYLSTNMSEPLRYSLAIVIAGVIYRVFFTERTDVFAYIIAPIIILYAMQVYSFFAFCIPIYVFAVMKGKALYKKLLASAVAMVVGAGGSYYILHLISSNYNIYKTERLLNCLKSADVIGALKAFVGMFKEGVCGVIDMVQFYFNNFLFLWYLAFCLILFLASVVLLIASRKGRIQRIEGTNISKQEELEEEDRKDRTIAIIILYSMLMYFFMYMTVYSIEKFTFLRGTAIVVLFSLSLLMMTDKKWLVRVVLALWAVGLVALPTNLKEFTRDRYLTQDQKYEWEALDQEFFSALKVKETDDRWKNTVAIYTLEPKVIAAMPSGVGVNMILNPSAFPTKAQYLVFSTKTDREELQSEWIETFYPDIYDKNKDVLDQNYTVIYCDKGYIVFERKK